MEIRKKGQLRPGDLVVRRSYGADILFKIVKIKKIKKEVILKGVDMRLIADAPLSDLCKPGSEDLQKRKEKSRSLRNKLGTVVGRCSVQGEEKSGKSVAESRVSGNNYFEIRPRILHLDSDCDYMQQCMGAYTALGLKAEGVCLKERKFPGKISRLLTVYRPDILVLTGHDAFNNKDRGNFAALTNYCNSLYYVKATRVARNYEPSRDDLIIFVGACQSHYEALLEAGANFASSPQRTLIHALDPVFVVEVLAYTPSHSTVDIARVIDNTVSGFDGIGGIESKGKLRLGWPKSPY